MPQNPHTYQVTQLAAPRAGKPARNEAATDLESLFTHHPKRNRDANLVQGVPANAENVQTRGYGVIGGEFQELMYARFDKYRSLAADQVLLIKDFILDDVTATDTRRVDVPAPVAGVVGRVDTRNGVVDICNPTDDRVIARIRHLGPIAVAVGEEVAYGQSLGTQNNTGLKPTAGKHVHIEMDTRHYQQFDNYIRDLVEGRLPVQAALREDVLPRPVVDDGVLRVGEAGERVAAVQRALAAGGYRTVGDMPIDVDGVYRLSMQGAVLAFQQDHGLAPTGDIDPDTWRTALDVTLGRPILPPTVHDPEPAAPSRPHEPLLQRIRGHVGAIDAAFGRDFDEASERMSLALARLAAERQLSTVDHVVLSGPRADAQAGARVFVVQGRLEDPAHRRAWMSTDEAVATPAEVSMQRLQGLFAQQGAGPERRMAGEDRGAEVHRMTQGG
jgi:hypothetical protein